MLKIYALYSQRDRRRVHEVHCTCRSKCKVPVIIYIKFGYVIHTPKFELFILNLNKLNSLKCM